MADLAGFAASPPSLLEGFEMMARMRQFEAACLEGVPTREIHGELHVGVGQEAIAAAMAGALQRRDAVVSTHRCHLHGIAKGVPLKPFLADFHGPYSEAAREAIRYGFDKEPAFIREGGSIGAVVTMRDYLDVPVTLIGLSLPEHGYHGPNEYYDWGQASGGIKALVKYFSLVSGIPSRLLKKGV